MWPEMPGAIQCCTQGANGGQWDPWPWEVLADAYKGQGDDDRAITLYQIAVKKIPTNSLSHKCLGDLYEIKQDYGGAITAYEMAIANPG